MVNDGSHDQEAVADLESVRLLLDKLTHPTPALTRLIDLVRRAPDRQGLMDSGERGKQRGSRGIRRARGSGGCHRLGWVRRAEMRAWSRAQARSR